MIEKIQLVFIKIILIFSILLLLFFRIEINAFGEQIKITSSEVQLDNTDPERTTVGLLNYLGGLRLRSANPSFGGLSGLWVHPNGQSLLSITDQGSWFTADLIYDADKRLTGISNGNIFPMLGIDNLPLLPPWSDAESIAISNGRIFVAFERQNRLYRYGPPSAPWSSTPEWLPIPEKIALGPRNGGMEAITGLDDKRIIAFAEEIYNEDGLAAWIFDGDQVMEFTLLSNDGFLPTGADMMPDGDILLLERRFSLLGGFAARLSKIEKNDIFPNSKVSGTEIAALIPPLTTDNFEGLSIIPIDEKSVLIFIISDDNFSALQQTLLLVFKLNL